MLSSVPTSVALRVDNKTSMRAMAGMAATVSGGAARCQQTTARRGFQSGARPQVY
jgi:hypothetical protein